MSLSGVQPTGTPFVSVGYDATGTRVMVDAAKPFASLLPKTRAALARVRSQTGRGKIAFIGPSTMRGLGSGTDGTGKTGMAQRAIPNRFAEILSGRGIPAEVNSMIGAGEPTPSASQDARMSALLAGWTGSTYVRSSIGGPTWRNNQANTNALTTTPTINYDNVDMYYVDNGAFPDFTYSINAGIVETISTVLTSALVRKKSYNSGNAAALATPGKYAMAWAKAAANASEINILGFDAWDSTAYKMSCLNLGWSSSSMVDTASTFFGWNFKQALALLAPDLTFIMHGTNDWWSGLTLSAFKATYQTLIATAKLSGDVILATFHPDARTDGTPIANQDAYNQVVRDLAGGNGLICLDLNARFGSYAAMNALGFYFDNVHLQAPGYSDGAELFAAPILGM